MSKARKQNTGQNRRVRLKTIEQPNTELTKKEGRRLRGGTTARETEDLAANKTADDETRQPGKPTSAGRQPMGF